MGNPKLRDLFYVDKITGDVSVLETANLDRDDGESKHEIFVILEDNYGRQGNLQQYIHIEYYIEQIITPLPNFYKLKFNESFAHLNNFQVIAIKMIPYHLQ